MIRQLSRALIGLAVLVACEKRPENVAITNQQPPSATSLSNTHAPEQQATSANMHSPADTEEADTTLGIFRRQWDPGRTDESQPKTRFLARAFPAAGNLVVLAMDTSIAGAREGVAARRYANADSVVIPNVRPGEDFTYYCRVGGVFAIGHVGALAGSQVPERWERPRLAWRFDTVAKRIRPIATDSVTCALSDPD
jgi:hypothetical protein